MDVGKSFRFVFDDKDWVSKLLLGLLVSIVPILNLAWYGYLVQMIRNVSQGNESPLPDWSDFGDKFVKGLVLAVATFIYSLPILAIIIIMAIGGVMADISTDGNLTDTVASVFAGVGILFGCLILLYALALTFYLPAVYIHYSREETFGSCFEVGKVYKLVSAHISEYLTAWVVMLLFGIVLGILSSILFTILFAIICIGWILAVALWAFLTVWPFTVYAHLFGQVGALSETSELSTS